MASLSIRTGTLGRRLALHLLKRSSMGFTRADVDAYAAKTATQAVADLFVFPAVPPAPLDPLTNLEWVVAGTTSANSPGFKLTQYVSAWWLYEAFAHGPNLSHKMLFFLHQNFVNDESIGSTRRYFQLRLLWHYAKGSYKTLARKMCIDNGMLGYLNTHQSSKTSTSNPNGPNENFPRELLELFTIGKGVQISPGNYTTYTETDIQETAKLLTGFRRDYTGNIIDPDTGLPTGKTQLSKHDINNKTFTSAFGSTVITGKNTSVGMFEELDDLIDMIFLQVTTAKNICRKLYRYFVNYDITTEIETDIITPLAADLQAANYDLETVVSKLLKSEHFYDEDDSDNTDESVGGIIKTPIELFIGTIKFFGVNIPDPTVDLPLCYDSFFRNRFLNYFCLNSGLLVFNPPNVAGYPAFYQEPGLDKIWANSSTLNFRYLFADMLLTGTKVLSGASIYIQMDVMAFSQNTTHIPQNMGNDPSGNPGPHDAARVATYFVQQLLDYLLPESVATARFDYFKDLLLGGLTELNWTTEWDTYIGTGNDASVKPQIAALIRGILQSPEYQLN